MANPHHVELLKQGVEPWNTWRAAHPDLRPDLSYADLQHLDLSGVDFRSTDLSHALLSHSMLVGAQLNHSNFSYATLEKMECASSDLNDALFDHASLQEALLTESSAVAASFQQATLSSARMIEVDLSSADFSRAILSGADLSNSDLTSARFHHALLFGTKLTWTRLKQTSLDYAYLGHANFTYAQFEETWCHYAMMGWTQLHDIDLSQMQGLETVVHMGPSEISVRTLSRSRGQIPEAFLVGCGLPAPLISQYRSPSSPFVPVPRCFIYYNEADQLVAERLQRDLSERGVRCWLQVDTVLDSITDFDMIMEDPAYRANFLSTLAFDPDMFDQVVLLLSSQSCAKEELQGFIILMQEQEQARRMPVIYPVMIEKDVSLTENVELLLQKTKNKRIWDFRGHEDQRTYLEALNGLFSDLQAH